MTVAGKPKPTIPFPPVNHGIWESGCTQVQFPEFRFPETGFLEIRNCVSAISVPSFPRIG